VTGKGSGVTGSYRGADGAPSSQIKDAAFRSMQDRKRRQRGYRTQHKDMDQPS